MKTIDTKPKTRSRKLVGTEPIAPEKRTALAVVNGRRGGRPLGSTNDYPKEAAAALTALRFRVRADMPEEASAIAGYARERILKVVAGAVHSRRAPSVIKGAVALIEEVCDPIVKEVKMSGTISLGAAVLLASKRIKDGPTK